MTSSHVSGVLDLTFLDIRTESDVSEGFTERSDGLFVETLDFRSRDPESPTQTMGTMVISEKTSPGKRKKPEEIKALRIANNLIQDVTVLCSPLSRLIDTSKVLWIDISFNQISQFDESLVATFPNLTTLHLHANNITKLTEIKKISKFPKLKSLALYGNPVEEHKHYRNYVLYYCTQLTQFDMSPVTKTERQRTEIWEQTFRRKLHPEDFKW